MLQEVNPKLFGFHRNVEGSVVRILLPQGPFKIRGSHMSHSRLILKMSGNGAPLWEEGSLKSQYTADLL